MSTRSVSERTILGVAQRITAAASSRVWVTAPWVTTSAAGLFFDALLGRVSTGEIDVRVVYRLKGADDLSISDLEALDRLAAAGVKVRYSNRLHAKVVIVDDDQAVVSSSNLTSTAGYSMTSGAWQNEELGVHLDGEAVVVGELAAEYEEIWGRSHELSETTVGLTLDETTSERVVVAFTRSPRVGEYVTVGVPAHTIGQVIATTAYNPTVTSLEGQSETLLGLRGGGGGRQSRVPGVETLFSHPSKTHALLMAQTFVQSAATYHLAEVAVLHTVRDDGSFAASTEAPEPGELVTEAAPALLDELISGQGATRVEVGHLPVTPAVRVTFDRDRLLTLHSAVLGMTGAGKSNAVKVMVRRLLAEDDLRVVIVDTHGEYAGIGLAPDETAVRVRFKPCLLDQEWVRRAGRTGRSHNDVWDALLDAVDSAGAGATVDRVLDALESVSLSGKAATARDRLVTAARAETDLELALDAATVIEDGNGTPIAWSAPGLYVLDLLGVDSYPERVQQTGALARRLLAHAKATQGDEPILLVVDEAQNYAPEQNTGRLSAARDSFEELFEIATEGRKFRCGLMIASQRPARVNKDVLSQCNTQLIFRLMSAEDLLAVRDCFEASSVQLLGNLPSFDVGVCFAAGAAVQMGVQVRFELHTPDGG